MNDSNGIMCKWCGRVERLESNEYCSPDCWHYSHDESRLLDLWRNDRSSLESALQGINETLVSLNAAVHTDGLNGENAHAEVRNTVQSLTTDANEIARKIETLSLQIAEIEKRF